MQTTPSAHAPLQHLRHIALARPVVHVMHILEQLPLGALPPKLQAHVDAARTYYGPGIPDGYDAVPEPPSRALRFARDGMFGDASDAELALDVASACYAALLEASTPNRPCTTRDRYVGCCDRHRHLIRSDVHQAEEAPDTNAFAEAFRAHFLGDRPDVNWLLIALVRPTPEVCARLTERQQGQLVGRWAGVLFEIADALEVIVESGRIDLNEMRLRKGTNPEWNRLSASWNRAREGLLDTLLCVGKAAALENAWFGRVSRVLPKPEKELNVWNELPRPWDVLRGVETLALETVRDACWRYLKAEGLAAWRLPPPTTPVNGALSPAFTEGLNDTCPAFVTCLGGAS